MTKPLANVARSVNHGTLPRTESTIGRVLAGWALAEGVSKTAKGWYDRYKADRLYTVAIEDEDDIYPDLHSWLLSMMPRSEQRSVLVETSSDRNIYVRSNPDDDEPRPKKLQVFYDGAREQTVPIGGHRVKVQVHREETPGARDGRYSLPERMVFTCQTELAREAVLQFL